MRVEGEHEEDRTVLERLLGAVTEVRAGEGVSALLLTFNVFLLLMAYYLIKPVREGLILALESGAEYKSYMSGAIAATLLVAVPAYAKLVNRLPRNRLVVGVTLFFVTHLVLFYVGSSVEMVRAHLGLIFYLWVGVFNMMVVAQFWGFANDIYSDEQGKRLFALIGLGASSGAAFGSKVASWLVEPLGVFQMLLVAAGLLGVSAVLTQLVHTREGRRVAPETNNQAPEPQEEIDTSEGAFQMVARHRYLVLLAAFSLVFTFVNTNGEYIFGRLVKVEAAQAAAGGRLQGQTEAEFITGIFANFFFYVNVLGLFLQTFVVSRLVKYLGLRVAFFVLPVIALLDATAVALVPVFLILQIGKTAENATDYSVNNTVRNMLWLPTTREMKYKAKQAVDTFFVRMGDVSSALVVFLGAGVLGLGVRAFALVNILLVVVWLWLAHQILKENKRLSEAK